MTTRTRGFASLLLLAAITHVTAAQPRPIPVKVVVVAMFEQGADTGDAPGELQYWVERDHLDKIYPLPAGYHAVRMNDQGEMAVLTGQGTAHAASTIMAVPRQSLRLQSYLLASCRHRRRMPGPRLAWIRTLGALGRRC